MKSSELLSELAPNSLKVYSHRQAVGSEKEERHYLEFDGTPEAFRFLASVMTEMAHVAEKHGKPGRGQSVMIDPNDLESIAVDDFDAISLTCRKRIEGSHGLTLG